MLNICKREFGKNLNRGYDTAFMKLRKQGLTWLPWVGKKYKEYNGLLVVGESNYADLELPGDTIDSAKQRVKNDENFTRKVVDCFGCCRRQKNKTFTSLSKILCGDHSDAIEDEEYLKVWQAVSFMDLVQEPMRGLKTCCDAAEDPKSRERPENDVVLDGWSVVKSVLSELKPSRVLFVGLGMVDVLSRLPEEIHVNTNSNGFRIGTLLNQVRFIAIPNPGGAFGFSPTKYAKLLKAESFV